MMRTERNNNTPPAAAAGRCDAYEPNCYDLVRCTTIRYSCSTAVKEDSLSKVDRNPFVWLFPAATTTWVKETPFVVFAS